MSILNAIKADVAPVGTIWASVGLSELSTNDIMQRLMWTLAIVVSIITIIRYIYKFCKWYQDRNQVIDYDDD